MGGQGDTIAASGSRQSTILIHIIKITNIYTAQHYPQVWPPVGRPAATSPQYAIPTQATAWRRGCDMENQHTDIACDNQDRNGITSRTPAHQSTHRSVQKCSIQWELNFVDNNKSNLPIVHTTSPDTAR